jgi:plastocyanin
MQKLVITLILILAIAGGAVFLLTPKKANSPTKVETTPLAESAEIDLKNYAFDPNEVTIKVGGEVTFVNNDSLSHSIVSSLDKSDLQYFESGEMGIGESFKRVFDKAGEYEFFSVSFPNMKGKIVVK